MSNKQNTKPIPRSTHEILAAIQSIRNSYFRSDGSDSSSYKKGNKYILVICDHFTKWVEVYAMKTITAAEVAKKLMKTICQHGIMEQILTDQGTNFQAELMKELYELLDVHQTRTSPFRPQTDGLSERFNQTLKKMITAYVDEIETSQWKSIKYITIERYAQLTLV